MWTLSKTWFIFVAILGSLALVDADLTISEQCSDGSLRFDPRGVILSHKGYGNSSHLPPVELTCFWLVHVQPGLGLVAQTVEIDLPGNCDDSSVTFYVPSLTDSTKNDTSLEELFQKVVGRPVCGSQPFRVVTKSSRLMVVFKHKRTTDGTDKKGFKIKYEALPHDQIEAMLSTTGDVIRDCNPDFEWPCPTSKACILKEWRCDELEDCSGGGDESNCRRPPSRLKRSILDPTDEDWGRVVNGQEAKQGAWPFIVSLRMASNQGHVCGASLISTDWVLTAAHCVQPMPNPQQWLVDVGRYYKDTGQHVQRIPVAQVIIHPYYDSVRIVNDIALLKLTRPVTMGTRAGIRFAPLPQHESVAKSLLGNTQCIVAGWGDTRATGSNSVLRQATLPIIDFSKCKSWLGTSLTEASFCAGYERGGIDACQGDSGGPLVCLVGGQMVQAGIVSWGADCAKPQRPGVYTNVAAYKQWIQRVF